MRNEIWSENRVHLGDSASKNKLLDYLSEGVPNDLLASLFGISIHAVNAYAKAVQHERLRIRISRITRLSSGALLELHDRVVNRCTRDHWDKELYRIVCDEIWTKVVLPVFPFGKYAELLEIIANDHAAGPYEKLAMAICGGFHSAERNVEHLVRNELSEILGQRKPGSECAASALLKSLKTKMGQRLRLCALNARLFTPVDRALVDRVLESLPPRESQVVKLRFGLSEGPMTLAQIGQLTHLSRSRIGQLEYRAIRSLRHPSRRRQLEHLFSIETVLKRLETQVAELTAERDELRRIVERQNSPQTDVEGASTTSVTGIPLDELDLSVRAYNGLRKLEVVTVGDILRYSESNLLRVKNVGRKTVAEIKTILTSMGLSLSDHG